MMRGHQTSTLPSQTTLGELSTYDAEIYFKVVGHPYKTIDIKILGIQ
jgi:hypothetical protein